MARADFGGQALLEGVLMRGRGSIAVALRHPDGSIVATTERLDSLLHRSRFARTPFFRGLVVLYETLVVGTRWLMRSGSVQAQGTGQEMGRGMIAVTLLLTIGLAVGLFVLLPLFLANATTRATIGPDQALLEHVRQYPTAHQRCGTEFLVIFIILSIIMFSLLAGQSLVVGIVGRILLIPVIA